MYLQWKLKSFQFWAIRTYNLLISYGPYDMVHMYNYTPIKMTYQTDSLLTRVYGKALSGA